MLRTLQNIGTLGSFVLALSVAALTIPRDVAFQVFLGTVAGGVSAEFIGGIDSALYVSLVLLGVAGALRFLEARRLVLKKHHNVLKECSNLKTSSI